MDQVHTYVKAPCESCPGLCCKQSPTGWGYATVGNDGQRVQYVDGRCPHLGSDDRCTLYGTPEMPRACASYNCLVDDRFMARRG